MRLPSRDFRLPGGLVCPANEIERGVWQEHVVKHPLGINAIARSGGRDPWNLEGWDQLVPPLVKEEERVQLASAIAALAEGNLRCEVPEIRGKRSGSHPDRLACRDCQAPVVVRCDKLLNAPGSVGERYRDVTDDLLAQLAGDAGFQVPPLRFHQAIHRLWQTPERLAGAIVLAIGLDDRRAARPIARVNRGDGVRAEFYFEEPDRLRWRTTYCAASRVRTGPLQVSFLGEVPQPAPRMGRVSELCVVARRWWEAHGI